jgi:hypothetical protein
LKDRPVVVVLARLTGGDTTQLLVAPITHSKPDDGQGIPIPAAVKRHLGMDSEQSWIVTSELNRFVWPGPDIRPAKGNDSPLYGAIPARLFDQVKRQISDGAGTGRVAISKRTE